MVQTEKIQDEGVSVKEPVGCLDGIDINNSCRQMYLRRMESIEECKRSSTTVDTNEQTTSIGTALARLRMEMVGLMDQDAGLMRQMLILNEKVEELKANNICLMSKESLDSQDSLFEMEGQIDEHFSLSEDSLYHTDEESEELSCDEESSQYFHSNKNDYVFSDSDENIDIGRPQEFLSSVTNDSNKLDQVFDKLLDLDTI